MVRNARLRQVGHIKGREYFGFDQDEQARGWANFVNEDVRRLTSTSHQVMYAFLSVLVSGQP